MKYALPSNESLFSALATNGRDPGLCKHVLDSGWWYIDESAPLRARVSSGLPPIPATPPRCRTEAASPLYSRLLATVRNDGWNVTDNPAGARIDLGSQRRAKAVLIEVEHRGHSLCAEILPRSCRPGEAVSAFVLRLTGFMRRVRASLLDFGCGPTLVWEVPLDPADESEAHLLEALCCLANAVQHGQAEAELMARDAATATRWLEMNFPADNTTLQPITKHDHGIQ